MANLLTNTSELTSIANAIRSKTGKSSSISFPSGFISEIGNISGGGGGSSEITKIFDGSLSSGSSVIISGMDFTNDLNLVIEMSVYYIDGQSIDEHIIFSGKYSSGYFTGCYVGNTGKGEGVIFPSLSTSLTATNTLIFDSDVSVLIGTDGYNFEFDAEIFKIYVVSTS